MANSLLKTRPGVARGVPPRSLDTELFKFSLSNSIKHTAIRKVNRS
jgi:hypothetical protein